MIYQTNPVCMVYGSRKTIKKTVENFDYKKKKVGGVIYVICPQTHKEFPWRYENEKELNDIRDLVKVVRNEVSKNTI